MQYNLAEDAQARLRHTYVLYDGHPHYVDYTEKIRGTKGFGARLLQCPEMRLDITVPLDDPKLNYMEYNLGYVNMENFHERGYPSLVYIARMPCRNPYKQGLCNSNVRLYPLGERERVSFDGIASNRGFVDMFKNKYPTLQECVERLEQLIVEVRRPVGMAFHRHLGLVRSPLGFYTLVHKGEEVAWGDPTNLRLPSQFLYLEEMLKELGVQTQ